ncbi:hypothetical protein L218DRAFT_979928 [Marasmius fiardii PR-910]|nr:hypothetical protein L218DRAFT_979928 [Marasmius fiardii PR-910]
MGYKENMGPSHNFTVKPEPQENTFPLSDSFSSNASTSTIRIKQQPSEGTISSGVTTRSDASLSALAAQTESRSFTIHQNAREISYDPEKALKEGLDMVANIQKVKDALQVGKLRDQVWSKEIEGLQKQALPTTLIAVCGATGAGKSSILNAILDDNIVPTSGMRACTAVVTEIGHHDKPTVDADVSFLSADEWKQELSVLLHDLADEDGNPRRINDLKSDAGVAWHKVNAVYPGISQERLVTMTPDQIIAYDPRVSEVLGTVKKIVARDSKAFSKEIAKYIDSKEKNRGKKDKEKKDGAGEKSLMDKVREAAGASWTKKTEKNDPNAPAFWPLIRQVNVRCRSACLSTGAILVDLPGVADANAARNNIAKAYMKKCQCLWILAPITRAVDDKTARDLLGDAFKMQLMTSKTDDISCSEVINALNLEDDPELETIEEEIDDNKEESKKYMHRKTEIKRKCRDIDTELKELRELIAQYQQGLEAIQNGESFKPAPKSSAQKGKKRKNKRGGKGGSAKRRRSGNLDSDEGEDESDEDSDHESSSDPDSSESEEDKDSDVESDGQSEKSDLEDQEYTEDIVKAKIKELRDAAKEARSRLTAVRSEKKEVEDRLTTLAKALGKIQKRKNAFCSLKRSEFSRDVLKEDFRTGLKELDDAAAEKRDPDSFDPTRDLRDYAAIDLPVFTCSSRDYVRLNNQVTGDGGASCFSNTDDTGIPALQRWCHTLTASSRARTARVFLHQLQTFANSIIGYIRGIGEVTAADRETLRRRWESNWPGSKAQDAGAMWQFTLDDDPFTIKPERPELDALHGVAPRLAKEFIAVIDDCVDELRNKFKDGLEDKCRTGAEQAAQGAVTTVDELAASMHWASYRATLRRHGCFRRDLNSELLSPFTRNIASAWGKMFESDLFGPFEAAAVNAINKLLSDVEDSAALGLKDRVKAQGEQCLQDAKVALTNSINIVRDTMTTEQKEISRSLAPHVQEELRDGYDEALEFRGTGSVRRQKDFFRQYVADRKNEMFGDGAEVVMERLVEAAGAVGKALEPSFEELAVKIEVALSVLWESVSNHDPQQILARNRLVELSSEVIRQIGFWNEAEKKNQERTDTDIVMSD